MTKHTLNGETFKLLLGIVTGAAGVWLGLVFFARQVQCGLYGIPSGMCTVMAAPQAMGVAFFILACGLVLFSVAAFVRSTKRRWRAVWLRLFKRDLPDLSKAFAGLVLLLLAAASSVPLGALSRLSGYLWNLKIGHGSLEADVLPLVFQASFLTQLVAATIVFGIFAVTVIYGIRLARNWIEDKRPLSLFWGAFLLVLGFLELASANVVFAATLPLVSQPPLITIHLKEASGSAPINAILVRQEESFILALPIGTKSPPLVLIPGEAISHVDYDGQTGDIKQKLSERLQKAACQPPQEHCPMPIKFPFYFGQRIAFEHWAAGSALLVLLGLFVAIPLPGRAENNNKQQQPPAATATKNVAPVLASAAPQIVVLAQSFYPHLHTIAHNTAEAINQFAGVFMRGDTASAGDIWLFAQNQPQRLTQDGDYTSLFANAAGTKVAFLRAGKIGILDVVTKKPIAVPTQATIVRLLGWDEPNEQLLAMRNDQYVVSIKIANGRIHVIQDRAASNEEITELDVLSHMTPSPGVLVIQENGTRSAVTEKKWGVQERTTYFVANCKVSNPAWSSVGIFYLSKSC